MYKFVSSSKIKNILTLCSRNKLYISPIFRSKSNSLDPVISKNVSLPKVEHNILDNNESNSNKQISLATQLVDKFPFCLQPYLKLSRIDRPIGSWLVFWPCGWSVALAAAPGTFPDLYLLTLFGFGSLVMRSAGCTINDMWDRDIDSKVARTNERPLVTGTISMRQAWIYLAGQLSVALLILLQLNWYSIFLGASSIGLVITYPLMKRITHWPQLVLGMTLNWGIMLGYSAVLGTIDWSICGPMYLSAVCWTTIYDTIYAHQDIADDILHGIKSTALKFKDNTKYWLTGFSTVMVSSLTCSGIMAEQTWPYYSAVALVASHLVWQIYGLNVTSPQDCASKFISNHRLGLILFLGIVIGNLCKTKNTNESITITN